MEGESGKKRPLDLDFDQLIDKDDFDPPEVVRVKKPAMAVEPKKELFNQRDVELWKMKDKDIDEEIQRQIRTVKDMGPKMPDKGEKLRLRLKKFEDEMERRRLRGPQRELEKSTQATSSRGDFNSFSEEAPPPSVKLQSSFATIFNQKIDNDTDCRTGNAFVKELSTMGRCNGQNTKNVGDFSQREREKGRSSSGHLPSLNPHNFYRNTNKSFLSNGDHKTRASSTHRNTDKSFLSNGDRKTIASTYSDCHIGENLCRSFSQKEDRYQLRNRNKKSQTIVLVDDEDPEFLDATEQTEEFPESMKDLMICYPTRDDPQSVDICYADTKCLDPQSYLTSSIMNFYIRYLHQACPTAISDYHIFNTYFYNKLKDAVSAKRDDKDDLFVKLRRWWKGVDIFQKAYILIPVNEELHWSLAIICIPDKEEESGPIILHLDSLGLHCSKSIFRNIKSFLIEEWCYLDQKSGLSDPPLSDCWKQFPDHIVERRLSVPQQKNDFDCGLFVLFFMERFIEDVPLRLKKTDLTMFGRQWFKPTEASRLRSKIRKLLKEEFQKAQDCTKSSSPTDTSEE